MCKESPAPKTAADRTSGLCGCTRRLAAVRYQITLYWRAALGHRSQRAASAWAVLQAKPWVKLPTARVVRPSVSWARNRGARCGSSARRVPTGAEGTRWSGRFTQDTAAKAADPGNGAMATAIEAFLYPPAPCSPGDRRDPGSQGVRGKHSKIGGKQRFGEVVHTAACVTHNSEANEVM